ncbi:MAG: PEP-CTERM sorting domain-containing protein [Hydrogenophilales bacterium]|nr:PEP-CTERM sorting domain-containing protein [Hydrogenophilales bacterium]
MNRMNQMAAGAFLLAQAFSGAAFATPVTLTGTTVDFTFDNALMGLFGQPILSGDTLSFTPVNFNATSSNGEGYKLTDNTVNVQMTAHNGYSFSSVDLAERGDYLLQGGGSTANVAGQVRVFDVSDPMKDTTTSIGPSAAMDQTGISTHPWTAANSTDLSAWNGTKSVNVSFQNLLVASTNGSSSLAYVDKKYSGLTATTAAAPVPEATSSAMMLAGLGLIGWQVRRRRS